VTWDSIKELFASAHTQCNRAFWETGLLPLQRIHTFWHHFLPVALHVLQIVML